MAKQTTGEKGMIFLDAHHPIIVETLTGLMGPEVRFPSPPLLPYLTFFLPRAGQAGGAGRQDLRL